MRLLYILLSPCLITCFMRAADNPKSILQQAIIARASNKHHNQLYVMRDNQQLDNGTVKIWSPSDLGTIATVNVPTAVQSLLYDSKNKSLYVGLPYALQIWAMNGERLEQISCHEHEKRLGDLRNTPVEQMYSWLCCQDVGCVIDNHAIFCFFSALIKAFFVDKEKVVEERRLFGHTDLICNLQKIPSYPILCSGSHDKTIKLWDMQKCFLLISLPCNDIPNCMSVDDNAIYVRYPAGDKQIWNIAKFIQASV